MPFQELHSTSEVRNSNRPLVHLPDHGVSPLIHQYYDQVVLRQTHIDRIGLVARPGQVLR